MISGWPGRCRDKILKCLQACAASDLDMDMLEQEDKPCLSSASATSDSTPSLSLVSARLRRSIQQCLLILHHCLYGDDEDQDPFSSKPSLQRMAQSVEVAVVGRDTPVTLLSSHLLQLLAIDVTES